MACLLGKRRSERHARWAKLAICALASLTVGLSAQAQTDTPTATTKPAQELTPKAPNAYKPVASSPGAQTSPVDRFQPSHAPSDEDTQGETRAQSDDENELRDRILDLGGSIRPQASVPVGDNRGAGSGLLRDDAPASPGRAPISDGPAGGGGQGAATGALNTLAPAPGDPQGGIPVDAGGTVLHRATGTITRDDPNDQRNAAYCWVEPGAHASCTDFKMYQFVCVVLESVDLNQGRGLQAPPHAAPGGGYTTETGSKLKFNGWTADDFPGAMGKPGGPSNTKNPKRKMPAGAAVANCQETPNLEGGVYYGFNEIPGQPNLDPGDTKARLRRLVDAPDLGRSPEIVDAIYKHMIGHPNPEPKEPGPQPDDLGMITVKVVFHFRNLLYCANDCLGRWDWSVDETLDIKGVWRQPSNSSGITLGAGGTGKRPEGAEEWRLHGEIVARRYGTPNFGAFQPCPGKEKQAHPGGEGAPPSGGQTRER